MCINACMCLYICVYVCSWLWERVCICMCVHVYMFVAASVYVCMCVYVRLCACGCGCERIRLYMRVYACVCMRESVCVFIHFRVSHTSRSVGCEHKLMESPPLGSSSLPLRIVWMSWTHSRPVWEGDGLIRASSKQIKDRLDGPFYRRQPDKGSWAGSPGQRRHWPSLLDRGESVCTPAHQRACLMRCGITKQQREVNSRK